MAERRRVSSFEWSTAVIGGISLIAGTIVYLRDGLARFTAILTNDLGLFGSMLPKMAAGCLVSAFVDQQKVIGPGVVDGVARDFDLADGTAARAMTPAAPSPEKFDVVEALRSLATIADRLREEEKDLPKERKL